MDEIKYRTNNAILALLLQQQELEEVKQEVGLVSNGDEYETHAGKFFTTDDLITLRDKATVGLGSTKFAGLVAKKYDGLNDGQLVFDADGYARVGDEDSLQMIATRENAPTDKGIAYYDDTTRSFKTKAESSLSVAQAVNANKLGNITAANYARTDIDETFNGDISINKTNANAGFKAKAISNSKTYNVEFKTLNGLGYFSARNETDDTYGTLILSTDGTVRPYSNANQNFGDSSIKWKNGYFSNTLYSDVFDAATAIQTNGTTRIDASGDYMGSNGTFSGVLGVGGAGSERLTVYGKGLFNNGGSLYIDSKADQCILANESDRPFNFEVNSGNKFQVSNAGTKTTGTHTILNSDGYGEIGSKNDSWFHFETDRPNFHFNKGIHAVDRFVVYGTNTDLSNGILKLNSNDWLKHTAGANEGWEIVTDGAKDIEILRGIGIINHRDTALKGTIGTAPYISGIGGKGTWRISQDANAEFDNLDIREGLTCNTFTNNKINISNGDLIVSDTDTIEYVDGNILYFSKEQPFRVGDILRCQGSSTPGNIKSYYITVESEGTSQSRTDEEGVLMKFITFTDKTGSGTIETDDILLRWNSSDTDRKGLLYMSSSSTYAPFYDVIYDGQTKARYGRLDGITTSTGKVLSGYGSWAQNGYFEGWINAKEGLIANCIINSDSVSTSGWALNSNGSGNLANGALTWDANGDNFRFASNVTLSWGNLDATTQANLKGADGKDGTNGTDGAKGDKGLQGVKGDTGANGVTTYTWIRYADSSTGLGISNTPTGKTYVGFAYNKTTPTESNTAYDYTWSLMKGADGINGTDGAKGDKGDQGVRGTDGADGTPRYTWIKYSNYSDGTSLYDTPNSTTLYIGIATNKTSITESSTKTDYKWSLFRGSDGTNGTDGVKGDTGSQGLQGVKGERGLQGIQGVQGIQGLRGIKGDDGITPTSNDIKNTIINNAAVITPTIVSNLVNTNSITADMINTTGLYVGAGGITLDSRAVLQWDNLSGTTKDNISGINFDPYFSTNDMRQWSQSYSGKDVPPATVGSITNNVYKVSQSIWVYSRNAILVDTSKRYRMRFRVKTNNTSTDGTIYAGVATLDANYNNITGGAGTHRYFCRSGYALPDTNWHEFEGIISGIGDGSSNFRSGTKYVRPMFIVDYNSGTALMEVDFITFEEVVEKGDKGDKGAQGLTGNIGAQGPQGPRGYAGADGAQGERGLQGIQGIRGIQGPVGPVPTSNDIKNTIINEAAVITPAIAANFIGTNRLDASHINFDNATGNNVNLRGTITATEGAIGAFAIDNQKIIGWGDDIKVRGWSFNNGYHKEVAMIGSKESPSIRFSSTPKWPSANSAPQHTYGDIYGLHQDTIIVSKHLYVGTTGGSYGNLTVNKAITAGGDVSGNSDSRLKKNIKPVESALDKLMKLRPVTFNWKELDDTRIKHGFIAQDVEEIYPELVNVAEDKDKTLSVNYIGLISELTKAVQELKGQIEKVKEKEAEDDN